MTLVVGCLCASAYGQAVVAGFNSSELPANDDGSTSAITVNSALPGVTNLNFFGINYNQFWLNNNGNTTFDNALSTFTPGELFSSGHPMLAPFWADVDTRDGASGTLRYGTGTFGGHNAWGATWGYLPQGGSASTMNGVGYYSAHSDKLNIFQEIIVDRSDTGIGNFDFLFNYDQIQWETGDVSGGSGGLGGSSARAGYTNGTSVNTFELPGSAVNGALLDTGPNALRRSSNIGTPGRWLFQVRNGQVGGQVPEPGVLALLVSGGLTAPLMLLRRRRR